MVSPPTPKTPPQMSTYAKACLSALAEQGLGGLLSLGGAFALSYYYDYRPTHDIDAWWENSTGEEERNAVRHCLEHALQAFGRVHVRRWGDVVSLELVPAGETRTAFSFQIGARSAQLEATRPAPWPVGLRMDSLTDLLASKMVALIERGAPRDFLDIYTLCHAGLTHPKQCWRLWQQRLRLSGGQPDDERAYLAIETHLARIAAHRPLDEIQDSEEQSRARRVRQWFKETFLGARMD